MDIFTKIGTDVKSPKRKKTSSLLVNITLQLPHLAPQINISSKEVLKIHANINNNLIIA